MYIRILDENCGQSMRKHFGSTQTNSTFFFMLLLLFGIFSIDDDDDALRRNTIKWSNSMRWRKEPMNELTNERTNKNV